MYVWALSGAEAMNGSLQGNLLSGYKHCTFVVYTLSVKYYLEVDLMRHCRRIDWLLGMYVLSKCVVKMLSGLGNFSGAIRSPRLASEGISPFPGRGGGGAPGRGRGRPPAA